MPNPEYLAMKSMFHAKVNRARQQSAISHRTYLDCIALLSNPMFNNHSVNLLNSRLNNPNLNINT